jgi:hypothetical protein
LRANRGFYAEPAAVISRRPSHYEKPGCVAPASRTNVAGSREARLRHRLLVALFLGGGYFSAAVLADFTTSLAHVLMDARGIRQPDDLSECAFR